jgi:hypothetical protein
MKTPESITGGKNKRESLEYRENGRQLYATDLSMFIFAQSYRSYSLIEWLNPFVFHYTTEEMMLSSIRVFLDVATSRRKPIDNFNDISRHKPRSESLPNSVTKSQ